MQDELFEFELLDELEWLEELFQLSQAHFFSYYAAIQEFILT